MAREIHLPPGWGQAWLYDAGHRHRGTVPAFRSYDHRGTQLVWVPSETTAGARFACDLEHRAYPAIQMAEMFRKQSPRDFLRAWVCTEVFAKLLDVPILVWLKKHGLVKDPPAGITTFRLRRHGQGGSATMFVQEHFVSGAIMAFGVRTDLCN